MADVYVDSRSRVWLLDINPFAVVTDSLLFDWSEDTLTAPLPPQPEEEELPPGVFLRLHFEPTPVQPHVEADGVKTEQSGPRSTRETGESNASSVACGAGMGCNVVGSSDMDFEFRCVPSSLHIVPDPMGRYRGPADVEMGTLMGGTGGGTDLEELIEACRLAATSD